MKRYALPVALLVMLWATEVMATTIGFNNMGGNNLDRFSSYTESGYTVSSRAGDNWYVAKVFGSTIPAIFAGPIYNPVESQITVTYAGGERFTFQGVDLTSNVAGGTSYTIAGSLNGVEVFTPLTVRIDSINRFETRLFSSLGLVDRLTITGKPGERTTSFNIDNIRAGKYTDPGSCPGPTCPKPKVPEPASIILLGAGLAGLGIWRRKAAMEKGV